MKLTIRTEAASDADEISRVTKAAFADCPHGNHTEQFIVTALRKAHALSVSLVAEVAGKVVGHVALSPVTVSDGTAGWYGLGPISVLPELQRRGIGLSLMREALAALKALDARGCILVGDPAYYERFGFRPLPESLIDGVPAPYVLLLPLAPGSLTGRVTFHPAFTAQS